MEQAFNLSEALSFLGLYHFLEVFKFKTFFCKPFTSMLIMIYQLLYAVALSISCTKEDALLCPCIHHLFSIHASKLQSHM